MPATQPNEGAGTSAGSSSAAISSLLSTDQLVVKGAATTVAAASDDAAVSKAPPLSTAPTIDASATPAQMPPAQPAITAVITPPVQPVATRADESVGGDKKDSKGKGLGPSGGMGYQISSIMTGDEYDFSTGVQSTMCCGHQTTHLVRKGLSACYAGESHDKYRILCWESNTLSGCFVLNTGKPGTGCQYKLQCEDGTPITYEFSSTCVWDYGKKAVCLTAGLIPLSMFCAVKAIHATVDACATQCKPASPAAQR